MFSLSLLQSFSFAEEDLSGYISRHLSASEEAACDEGIQKLFAQVQHHKEQELEMLRDAVLKNAPVVAMSSKVSAWIVKGLQTANEINTLNQVRISYALALKSNDTFYKIFPNILEKLALHPDSPEALALFVRGTAVKDPILIKIADAKTMFAQGKGMMESRDQFRRLRGERLQKTAKKIIDELTDQEIMATRSSQSARKLVYQKYYEAVTSLDAGGNAVAKPRILLKAYGAAQQNIQTEFAKLSQEAEVAFGRSHLKTFETDQKMPRPIPKPAEVHTNLKALAKYNPEVEQLLKLKSQYVLNPKLVSSQQIKELAHKMFINPDDVTAIIKATEHSSEHLNLVTKFLNKTNPAAIESAAALLEKSGAKVCFLPPKAATALRQPSMQLIKNTSQLSDFLRPMAKTLNTIGNISMGVGLLTWSGSDCPEETPVLSQACDMVKEHPNRLLNLSAFPSYICSYGKRVDGILASRVTYCKLMIKRSSCFNEAKSTLLNKTLPAEFVHSVTESTKPGKVDDGSNYYKKDETNTKPILIPPEIPEWLLQKAR